MATTTVLSREDVPLQDRWNAESVFATPQAWEEAFRAVRAMLEQAEAFKGTLAQSPERLQAWLEFKEALNEQYGKLRVYATMAYSCNTYDAAASARHDRVRALGAELSAKTAFAEPELVAIGRDTLRRWQEDNPALAVYGHYVDKLLSQAAHLRSAEVEELLGALSSPFATATATHGVLANTDLAFAPAVDSDGNRHEISQGNVRTLLASPDRTLRESAYKSYASAHLTFKNTMANVISAGMKQNVFMARARRYGSALEAALAPEDIPTNVFHTLIETFKANLPTWHRYWRVRREMLGVDTLHPHDTFAPLSEHAPEIPYEQAVAWIAEALRPLGDEYVTVLRRGALEERWVDKYPNKGKRMGAFSAGVKGAHPFIMMSYTDDAFGMSTLAHELGHSMHSHFTWQHQPTVYRYSLFVAEVASNFNQAMLRAYLFEQNPERAFQIAIIEEAMANFYRYFFVMPTLARFELELHQRIERSEALGADDLTSLMADLFAEGYGDEVRFEREHVGITWAQFHTHLYSRFYVYQYATGISGAHALAKRVLEGGKEAAEDYLAFLKVGGARYPLDALRRAGVDLSTPAPVEATFGVLAGLVARLESLVD